MIQFFNRANKSKDETGVDSQYEILEYAYLSFDAGIKVRGGDKVEIKAMFTTQPSSGQYLNLLETNSSEWLVQSSSQYWFLAYNGDFIKFTNGAGVYDLFPKNQLRTLVIDGCKMYIDGTNIINQSAADFITTKNLRVCTTTYTLCRFYELKYYYQSLLIRHLRPARNIATNEYGVYDMVSKQFIKAINIHQEA